MSIFLKLLVAAAAVACILVASACGSDAEPAPREPRTAEVSRLELEKTATATGKEPACGRCFLNFGCNLLGATTCCPTAGSMAFDLPSCIDRSRKELRDAGIKRVCDEVKEVCIDVR